jgi:hypothetical protein
MTARVLLGLSWALLLSAQGRLPNDPNQPTAGPKHTVTGTVSNALTGEPIRRALVQLFGQTQMSALTGPDGRFSFEDVPEGPVGFNAQRPGFHNNPNEDKPLKVGSGSNDFALKLYPDARISGHVTDANGEPIEGANVQAIMEVIQQGRRQWQRGRSDTTDEDGGFEFEGVTPGHYVIYCAGHEIPPMSWNAPREVYPPSYYPEAKDRTAAQAVELQAGQEFSADFHLHRERGYTVKAQVTNFPGRASVMLQDSGGQTFRGMRSDRQPGQFTAEGVPSGTWVLSVQGGNQQGDMYGARQEFTIDHADVIGLQVQAQKVLTIPVVVNLPDNEPAEPPKQVGNGQFMSPNTNIQAQLIPDKPTEGRNYFAIMQGNPPALRFMNVLSGKYKLSVRSFGNACLDSATYGGVDLTRDELVVAPDGGAQPVVLNLGSDCAVLKVTIKVEGGNPSVVILPASGAAEPIAQQTTGVIQFKLPQGTYQVFAFANLEGLEYANPEAMRNYGGQSITLEAGQEKDITLEITERKDH